MKAQMQPGRYGVKHGGVLSPGVFLTAGGSDDPSDPVVMLRDDGTGAAANADEFIGDWIVMAVPVFAPGLKLVPPTRYLLVGDERQAKFQNYYFHDYYARLRIAPDGSVSWEHYDAIGGK